MNKRGQFFLIAALLISGIAIGFSTLYNSAYIEQADTQVYDLSEELYAELQQTYDAGTVRGQNQDEIQANLKKLADYYQQQNPDSTFVIFYGSSDSENCKKGEALCIKRLDTTADGSEFTLDTQEVPASGSAGSRTTQDAPSTSGTLGLQSEKKENENTAVKTYTASSGAFSLNKKAKIRVKFKEASKTSAGQATGKPTPAPASSATKTSEQVIESPVFEVKPGQNFYYVIRKKVKNEHVVVYR